MRFFRRKLLFGGGCVLQIRVHFVFLNVLFINYFSIHDFFKDLNILSYGEFDVD